MALRKCKNCGKEISKKASQCYNCGALTQKKSLHLPWIISIIVIGYVAVNFSGDIKKLFSKTPKDTIMNNIDVDIMRNDRSSDNVMTAYLTIKNNSQYSVKDLDVMCTNYDDNGSRVGGKTLTIDESISPNEEIDVNNVSLGFKNPDIVRTECEVVYLDVM